MHGEGETVWIALLLRVNLHHDRPNPVPMASLCRNRTMGEDGGGELCGRATHAHGYSKDGQRCAHMRCHRRYGVCNHKRSPSACTCNVCLHAQSTGRRNMTSRTGDALPLMENRRSGVGVENTSLRTEQLGQNTLLRGADGVDKRNRHSPTTRSG